MVYPGDNQPPSDPFAPTPPPPPGQFGPGQYGPGPIGPSSFQPAPPSGGSDAWKFILIGCAALLLLGGIVTVGGCALLASKGGSAMPKLIKFIKSEYVKHLSADHTPEQRARFEEAYNFYADECARLGFLDWISKYTDAIDKLTAIDSDQQITVDESQAWADMILSGGSTPPDGEEGSASGDSGGGDSGGGGETGSDSGGDSGNSGSDSGGDSGGDFGRGNQ